MKSEMEFEQLQPSDESGIKEMSDMATAIVREHFDPLIGKEQNDYMLALFQSRDAIRRQLEKGYRYYFVRLDGRTIGFVAFYPKGDSMVLSKFYLYREERGKGYSRRMMDFVIRETRSAGLTGIELNVNRHNSACRAYEHLGFRIIRSEKNDIGQGFYMDDHVYRLDL